MTRHLQNPTRMAAFLCFLFIIFQSCSKDADLLSDYVINNDQSLALQKYVVNDQFFVDSSNSIVLDVLNNDRFDNPNNVSITQTSSPANGEVTINGDNTLTYSPQVEVSQEEQFTDTFTYNAQEVNEDGSVTEEEGNVIITNNDSHRTAIYNEEVNYWKAKFDAEWIDNDNQIDSQDALARARSGNLNQEYYFLGNYIDGLTKIWQATGDNEYLDIALNLINITINDATMVESGFLGWPNRDNNGYALWDSYYWRHVSTLLRILYKSPLLRSTSNYQSHYQNILDFSEKHIWDRYESQSLHNFYRVNTHMSSHWARIGMELYIITGKQKYKTVFENISFGKMLGYPSNLRNQFKSNPTQPSAYTWSQRWDINQIQDTSHAGAIISFIVTAYENNMYWSSDDINSLTETLNQVVWKNEFESDFMKNVDGSGGPDLHGRLHEWLILGSYDQSIQDKIKNYYIGNHLSFFGVQPIGIAALNARILADGKPVYPEQ